MGGIPARIARYVQSDRGINLGHCHMLYRARRRYFQRRLGRGVDRRDPVVVGFGAHRRRRKRISRRRNVGGLRRRCRLRIGWSWVDGGL